MSVLLRISIAVSSPHATVEPQPPGETGGEYPASGNSVDVFAGKGENVEKFGKLGTTSNRQQDSTDPPGNARFEIETHPRRLTRFYASVDTQVCISEGSSEHSGLIL